MMSRRQGRPAPFAADVSQPAPFRNTISRQPDLSMDLDGSLTDPFQVDMQHFSLSSLQLRPQYIQQYLANDCDFLPGMDDALSAPTAACGSVTLADISPPESVSSRCDPLEFAASPAYSSGELCTESFFAQDLGCGSTYNPFSVDWPSQRPLSPPPEPVLSHRLDLLEEPALRDQLAVSKVQLYSKQSRSSPRPLRPSNERRLTQDSTEDADSLPVKDDPERVKARTDPLYDTKPDQDGFYHCPKKTEFNCNHKATKQKCIFAKYLDSHLRPYVCKYASTNSDCEDLRFSSNACLFRHEREAHGMHNHGHNPYVCDYQGCERAKPGNGFPRRWNQRDHMKRVHGYDAQSRNNNRHGNVGRRRQAPDSVPMKRSGTSNKSRASEPYPKDTRPAMTSRHEYQPMYNPLPECTFPMDLTLDPFQFAPHDQMVFYHPPMF